MKILFSPVGTADPLTMLGDGPMLNIVRYHRPDKVVLFFSPKMAMYQERDKRYTKAIELLCASEGAVCPERKLVKSPHQAVYQFDHYIEEFEEILTRLKAENPKAMILVNVSSGTPAMEQALVALGSFGHLDIQMLQVITPRKDINDRSDREDPDNYDLDVLWECSFDEGCDTTNRVHVVESPNFGARLMRENARLLVAQYEYEAAAKILSSLRVASGKALSAVRAAADRLNLDHKSELRQKFNSAEVAYRQPNLLENQLAEYIWVMEVRYQQGHWAEFARSVTPALAKLILLAIKPYLSEAEWAILNKEDKLQKQDYQKVVGSKYLGPIARDVLANRRKVYFLSNNDLMGLLDDAQKNGDLKNEGLYKALCSLRKFENMCRNKIAHEIQATKKEDLERLTRTAKRRKLRGSCSDNRKEDTKDIKLEDVKDWLFQCFNEFEGVEPIEPGMYDRINDWILTLI